MNLKSGKLKKNRTSVDCNTPNHDDVSTSTEMRSLFGSDESPIRVNDIASDTWIQPCQMLQCILLAFACSWCACVCVSVCVQCTCMQYKWMLFVCVFGCRCVIHFGSRKPGAYFCISPNHHLCLYISTCTHSLTHSAVCLVCSLCCAVCCHHTCLCVHVGRYYRRMCNWNGTQTHTVICRWWFVYLCVV